MDFNTTIPLRTNSDITNSWRLVISLVIALSMHAVLITIPVTLTPDATIDIPPSLQVMLLSSKNIEASPAPETDHSSSPAKPQEVERSSPESPDKVQLEQSQATSQPDKQGRAKSVPIPEVPPAHTGKSMPLPILETFPAVDAEYMDNVTVGPGTKRKATVFDPMLEKRLVRERNKVRKFQPTEANYKTATSTFVQVGNRCFNVKDLPVGNTDSDLNPWFKAKCPKNSRSQADIDRLAEKYGIP